jgi:hypothetical protein
VSGGLGIGRGDVGFRRAPTSATNRRARRGSVDGAGSVITKQAMTLTPSTVVMTSGTFKKEAAIPSLIACSSVIVIS